MTPKPPKPPEKTPKPKARKPRLPAAPKTLGPAGKRIWTALHDELPDDWIFDGRELVNLESAGALRDVLEDLRAAVKADGVLVTGSTGQKVIHPALPEIRQTAQAIARHLGQLELPSEETGKPETAASARGRKAAKVRWDKRDEWQTRRAAAKGRRGEA